MSNTLITFYFGVVLVLSLSGQAASLTCSSCKNVDNIEKCQDTENCGSSQSCFTRAKTITGVNMTFYSMGCIDNTNCGNIHVYKALSSGTDDDTCFECCGDDRCNGGLCDHPKAIPCADATGECAYWNEKFNICDDIHEAKVICRKFCNLCKVVDGNWAHWSSWSGCDVTCGQGKHTRTRTCTNPAPAYKGLDCQGVGIETKPCTRQLCPVHGGWADWSDWGNCPVSCGTGIQKRHRTCTDPSPLRYGEHCFGDTIDVQLCGQDLCPGKDGGWSDWGVWSTCSVSCNLGLRKRSRTCTNPAPGPHGKHCDGDTTEVENCNIQECDVKPEVVAFNAYYVTDCTPSTNERMIFSSTYLNAGNAYSNTTGIFVAPRNGTYMFSAQFCIYSGRASYFYIMVGDVSYAGTYAFTSNSVECQSVQTILQILEGEQVYVKWGSSKGSIYQNTAYGRNSFTGILIEY